MPKYDYTNSTIDKKDKHRLHFYEEVFTMLELLKSENNEINELIGWMGVVLGNYTKLPKKLEETESYLKEDQKLDDCTYLRNVSIDDMRLYSIISAIKEILGYQEKDSLSDITNKLYDLLDKQFFPYHKKNLDIEDINVYVELKYISKEQQKENEKIHSIKYDDSEI